MTGWSYGSQLHVAGLDHAVVRVSEYGVGAGSAAGEGLARPVAAGTEVHRRGAVKEPAFSGPQYVVVSRSGRLVTGPV